MRRIRGSDVASRGADIYLRDWNIKYELRNRAMIYDYVSKIQVTPNVVLRTIYKNCMML